MKIVSVLVYSLGLMAMFSASGIYHSAMVKPAVLQTLRKIDHSAIFLLIAGTYTPFCLLAFTGFWHWGLLALIWAHCRHWDRGQDFLYKIAALAAYGHLRGHGLAVRHGCAADAVCAASRRDGVALRGRGDLYPGRSGVCHQDPGFRAGKIRLPRSLAHLCSAGGPGAFHSSC